MIISAATMLGRGWREVVEAALADVGKYLGGRRQPKFSIAASWYSSYGQMMSCG